MLLQHFKITPSQNSSPRVIPVLILIPNLLHLENDGSLTAKTNQIDETARFFTLESCS